MDDQLRQSALDLHESPVPGKIQVSPTKPLATQRDLALIYSPGVAAPYSEIEKGPLKAYKCTARDSLVAVISGSTTVLGLGNIGALADKPVMEGKGVLLKKFAGIDVSDIEADELDPDKSIKVVAALEPTFSSINLESVEAPKCFYVEQKLRGRTDIPVFHDDQHNTTITSTTAIPSGLYVVGKNISDMWMVVSSADAAAIACMNLLVALDLQKHNIVICDPKGVICQGREPDMAETKAMYAVVDDGKRTLDDVIEGVDIFLGCSGPEALTQEMAKKMARAPTILTLANPEPGILPPLAKEVCLDVITRTGRSDYPNQVNNVLCFPSILRGALNVGATAVNEEMKLATVRVVVEPAHARRSGAVASTHGDQNLSFGPGYIIPKPLDPRLIVKTAPVVAKTVMESGVATHPIVGFDVYIDKLIGFAYRTNLFMKPIFSQARKASKRVVLPEEEEVHVLHATQELVTPELTKPILIGRPSVIKMRIQKLGLQIKSGVDSGIVNNESDPRFKEYRTEYSQIAKRRDVIQKQVQRALINSPIVIGVIMVQRDEADAMTCGTIGDYHKRFSVVKNVFDYHDGARTADVMSALLSSSGNTFIIGTYVNDEPDIEGLAEIALMATETVRCFGIEPCVALLSHSNFGSSDCPSSGKIRQALELVRERAPELMIDGEIHGDAALVEAVRNDRMPNGPLKSSANILVMPNMETARVSYNLLRVPNSEGVAVGPVLVGVTKPVYVLMPTASVCHIVNMMALVVVEA